jgi:hypothetical protein
MAQPTVVPQGDGTVEICFSSDRWILEEDEIVVYRAEDMKVTFPSGWVIMSDDPEFGLWDVDGYSRLEDDHLYDKDRGLWLNPLHTGEDYVEDRVSEPPKPNDTLVDFNNE